MMMLHSSDLICYGYYKRNFRRGHIVACAFFLTCLSRLEFFKLQKFSTNFSKALENFESLVEEIESYLMFNDYLINLLVACIIILLLQSYKRNL